MVVVASDQGMHELTMSGRLAAWPPTTMSVLFETSLGDLVIDLEVDTCPKTCENFLKLCKVYYYNLNAFFNGEYWSSPARIQDIQYDIPAPQSQRIFWLRSVIPQLQAQVGSLSGLW